MESPRIWTIDELNALPVGTKFLHPAAEGNIGTIKEKDGVKYMEWANLSPAKFAVQEYPWNMPMQLIVEDPEPVNASQFIFGMWLFSFWRCHETV